MANRNKQSDEQVEVELVQELVDGDVELPTLVFDPDNDQQLLGNSSSSSGGSSHHVDRAADLHVNGQVQVNGQVGVGVGAGAGVDEHRTIAVRRPLFTRADFELAYAPKQEHKTFKERAKKLGDNCRCDRKKCTSSTVKLFPVYNWLRFYDVKNWLLLDVVCGITIGIINIPQSMGFALLSGVEPLYGLYSSFLPPLLYVIFGTSRNMCYGTLAVTSLLVGSVVVKVTDDMQARGVVPKWVFLAAEHCDPTDAAANATVNNTSVNTTAELFEGMNPVDYVQDLRARIAICLCFMIGIIQLLIGVFRLGFLTIYFADAMMAGYTCATMIYALVSQLKYLFGIHFIRPSGPLNIIFSIVYVFKNIGHTNVATLIISIISCTVLLVFKFVINKRVMRKIRTPIPAELLVVVAGILASYYLNVKETWHVDIIGIVKPGIPPPKLPDFGMIPALAGDGVVVALVNFGVSIALASVLARKHKIDIDENQEAISYGISNLVSSFFQCIPTGGAVASTCVEESMKGKTQLIGLIAAVFMVFVLAFITELFSSLPVCILSAIIVVGLAGMIDRFKQVKHLWEVSKFDCAIWCASFSGTVLLDVDIGLMFSILASFFILVLRTQAGAFHQLGNIPNTDIYEPTKTFKAAVEVSEIKIFRVCSPINFANAPIIRKNLYAKSGINPAKIIKSKRHSRVSQVSNSDTNNNLKELIDGEKPLPVRYIILDVSVCAYIDFSGLRVVKQILSDYSNVGIMILLSGCNVEVRRILQNSDFYTVCDPQRLFISVHDAVLAAQRCLIPTGDTAKPESTDSALGDAADAIAQEHPLDIEPPSKETCVDSN